MDMISEAELLKSRKPCSSPPGKIEREERLRVGVKDETLPISCWRRVEEKEKEKDVKEKEEGQRNMSEEKEEKEKKEKRRRRCMVSCFAIGGLLCQLT